MAVVVGTDGVVQALGGLTAVVALMTAALQLAERFISPGSGRLRRRGLPPVRPIATASMVLPRRTEEPAELARRPVTVRRILLGMALLLLVTAGVLFLVLRWTGSSLWAAALLSASEVYLAIVLVAKSLNIETANVERAGLSRHHRTTELDIAGKPLDVLADWQALVAEMRFELDFLFYDRRTGRLALTCRRTRLLRTTGWSQYVAVYGTLREDEPSSLIVLADAIIPVRRDLDANQATIERILQHYALPYPGDRTSAAT
jgi:hypothetical protein